MPQPIDINTELTRSTAVQRMQELADRASLAAQHRHAQDAEREQVDAETRVQQAPESEQHAAISGSGSGSQRGKQRRGSRKHEDAASEQAEPQSAGALAIIPDESDRHNLDVTV